MKVVVRRDFEKKAAKQFRKHPDKRRRVERTLRRLEDDPFHPALGSKKYDEARNIFQSNVEQGTPGAWRVWWIWSEQPDTIEVIGFGPHP